MILLVINGPNLNLLGIREPELYGSRSYDALCDLIQSHCAENGIAVTIYQSNHEGEIVDKIQQCMHTYDAIVINPAAYTHTSVAILDALKAVGVPAVEVHLTDVDSREDYRKISYVREACIATVSGLGFDGYIHAIDILRDRLNPAPPPPIRRLSM